MSGVKGQKWANKRKRYTVKVNTAITEKTGDAIKKEATKENRTISFIMRRALEKIFG